MEGVEPTHSYEYQILSLARLPIPPHRLPSNLSPLRYTKVPNMRKHLLGSEPRAGSLDPPWAVGSEQWERAFGSWHSRSAERTARGIYIDPAGLDQSRRRVWNSKPPGL